MKFTIGLQLYSIQKEMEKDFIGSLKKVRQIGYDGVEFAGFGPFTADALKKELDQIGLLAMSAHVGFERIREHMDAVVSDAVMLGLSWVICPGHALETRKDIEELSHVLILLSEKLKPHKIKVGYHNHSHEFTNKIDGICTMDLLVEATKGNDVFFEIDTCWAGYANVDPVSYIDSLRERSGPVHCKDLNHNYKELAPHDINAEVGTGCIDFPAVLSVMKKNHTQANGLIVEQEGSSTDIWNSVEICYKNLRAVTEA